MNGNCAEEDVGTQLSHEVSRLRSHGFLSSPCSVTCVPPCVTFDTSGSSFKIFPLKRVGRGA